MVEVNSTFYSVPDLRTVERWSAVTPDDFAFDVKLHQLFSFHSTPANGEDSAESYLWSKILRATHFPRG